MSASTCANGDQSVGTTLNSLVGKSVVDDVMQGNAAAGMGRLVHFRTRAQRGDPYWHFPARANFHVALKARVGAMNDLVYRKRGGGRIGVGLIITIQLLRDFL